MKAKEINSNKKSYHFTSIRVKEGTKYEVNKLLKKVNQSEDCGKVTFDILVNYFLERMTKEDMKTLQVKSITWAHEETYLRRVWEQKKGKISDEKWKKMLFLGELQRFISSHSRFRVVTNS